MSPSPYQVAIFILLVAAIVFLLGLTVLQWVKMRQALVQALVSVRAASEEADNVLKRLGVEAGDDAHMAAKSSFVDNMPDYQRAAAGLDIDRRMLGDYGPLTNEQEADVDAFMEATAVEPRVITRRWFDGVGERRETIVLVHTRAELCRVDHEQHPRVVLEDGTSLSGLWVWHDRNEIKTASGLVILAGRSPYGCWTMPVEKLGRK